MQGFGATLARHNGTSFQDIGGVMEMPSPSLSRDTQDATTFDSAGGYREFEASGLIDAGEASFVLVWDPADTEHDDLLGDIDSSTSGQFKITWVDNSSFTCSGFVTGFEVGTPLEDKVTANVTIKWTGQPTWA